MSLNTSLVIIRGDRLARIPDVLELFQYRLSGTPRHVQYWTAALAAADARSGEYGEIGHKVAFMPGSHGTIWCQLSGL